MNDPSPLSDLIADDLLLDRLAARVDAGSDRLAGLLGALAAQADTPLPLRTGRRRIGNKHRYLGAFAALAVAASGAGVAAAVTVPAHGSSQPDRALTVTLTDDSARSHVPTTPLPRLGLPQTSRSTHTPALVLARRGDGDVVLVPAGFVAAPARPGGATPRTGETGNGETGNGETGKGQTGSSGHQSGTKQAGSAQTPTHGKKQPHTTTTTATKASKGTKAGGREGKDVKKPAPTTTPATNQPPVGPQSPPAPATTGSPLSTALHGVSASGASSASGSGTTASTPDLTTP